MFCKAVRVETSRSFAPCAKRFNLAESLLPRERTATTRRSRSGRSATGSIISRRAIVWLVVKPGTGLRFELAAVAKRLDGLRATLFPRPGGHPIPVVSGLVSNRDWMAEAMGVEPGEVLARFQDAALNPIPWRETTSAPAQEVVHRQVDLELLLPLPTHNEHDSGPYVTAGLMITRNPRTGKQNVSIHRCQLSGPNRLGVLLLPRHAHMFFEMAEQGGQRARSRHRRRDRPAHIAGLPGHRCRSMSTSWRSPARCTGGRCPWSSA